LTAGNSVNITPVLPGFSYIFTQGSNIRIILSALSQVTHVEVVSSPNVMVLNNGTALLQVGNQVPISTGQAVSVTSNDAPIVNSIAYHATGVILKVTPSVNRSGLVTLDILQEVSAVAPDADQSATIGSPTFTERKVKSTVSIHDSETVALGGLISNTRTRGSKGLPFLSELPVVGGLFGTKQDTTDRTELMVLITPHVVENLEAARAVTEELRREFPSITPKLLHADQ
jgi:general secretion pathway protein D